MGGGVAIYIQSHIPSKVTFDLMVPNIEAPWLEVRIAHHKPIITGCVYRLPSASVQYLEELCFVLIKVTDMAIEIFVLGDFNIDWLSESCPNICNLY